MPRRTTPLRSKGFRGGSAWGSAGSPRRIRPRSTKRAAQEAEYRKLRAAFLEDACCARCGTTAALTVQHMAGRVGAALTDVDGFLCLCWPCHMHVESFRAEAMAEGWALSRLAKRGAA